MAFSLMVDLPIARTERTPRGRSGLRAIGFLLDTTIFALMLYRVNRVMRRRRAESSLAPARGLCYTRSVPTSGKKGTWRGSGPHKGKRKEDAQLFVLSALVFILFALLASLILVVRKSDPNRPILAIGESRPAEERPTESGDAVPEEPATQDRPALRQDPSPPERVARPENAPPKEETKKPAAPRTVARPEKPPKAKQEMKPAAPPERVKKGDIIIVIDDVGDNVWQLEPFLEFPGPITFAIKPGLAFTKKARDMIAAAGKDYIIHQPMEALDKLDPGPGALYRGMEDAKIRETLQKNFSELPGAKGMNNHMGSVSTKDLRIMRQVLRFTKSVNIPFLDSRTIGGTATEEAARLENAVYGERDVFLDNSPERDKIIAMFKDGEKVADKRGRAVMIGHVWSAELAQALMELYPELVSEGYSLTSISRIMIGDDDVDPGY